MARIRDDIKQQILDRSDIAEVIGEHIQLRPAGSRFKALCPFHKEKTPSFIVSPDKQIFHCFGCQTGGDVIKFIQLHENLDFVGALEYLARRVGVRLEWTGEEQPQGAPWEERLLHDAMSYYQQQLKKTEHPDVRSFLKKRGLDANLVARFQIGYADPQWDSLVRYFQRKKVEPEQLVRAGLAAEGTPGQFRDWFRHRLLFPILTLSGQVVGFGGRALGDDPPKYINSPETRKFRKGRLLYGLNLAKKALQEQKTALLAEGYMDVVALHRHGFTHTVASLGTALTEDQARLLKRYVERCFLVYDGDEAGRKAALRAIDVLRDVDLPCRVVSLPDGTDPDDLLSQQGREALDRLVAKAPDAFDFRMEWICRQYDTETLEGRRAVAHSMGGWLLAMPSELARAEYWGRLSERLKTPVHLLQQEVGRTRLRGRRTQLGDEESEKPPALELGPPSRDQLAKQGLVALMLDSSEYVEPVKEFWLSHRRGEADSDPYDKIIDQALTLFEQQGKIEEGELLRRLEAEGCAHLLSRVLLGDPVPENRDKALQEYCRQIRYHRVQRQIALQLQRLGQVGDPRVQDERLAKWIEKEYELERERYRLGENV